MKMGLSDIYTAVILRSALLRASKDGREQRVSHPSRLAEGARTSEAVNLCDLVCFCLQNDESDDSLLSKVDGGTDVAREVV